MQLKYAFSYTYTIDNTVPFTSQMDDVSWVIVVSSTQKSENYSQFRGFGGHEDKYVCASNKVQDGGPFLLFSEISFGSHILPSANNTVASLPRKVSILILISPHRSYA